MNPQVVVDAFEALLTQEDEEIHLLSNWDVEQLLEFLRRSPMDEDVLALLEWRLLPVIGIGARIPLLERRLARDPAFFVEILSLSHKPHSGEIEAETDPYVARNAYRLLNDWTQIPGSDEPGGEVDEDRLKDWLGAARQLLVDADRRTVGEIHIGKVFAHARIDDDGIWPTLVVRNMIEDSARPSLERGFHTGTLNRRGVTFRAPGGEQERTLARDYDRWATAVADQWPRTAATLRSLADSLRWEGRSHDDDERRLREGLDRGN